MNQDNEPKILVVNPGSTSTRVALFVGDSAKGSETLPAPASIPAPTALGRIPRAASGNQGLVGGRGNRAWPSLPRWWGGGGCFGPWREGPTR